MSGKCCWFCWVLELVLLTVECFLFMDSIVVVGVVVGVVVIALIIGRYGKGKSKGADLGRPKSIFSSLESIVMDVS